MFGGLGSVRWAWQGVDEVSEDVLLDDPVGLGITFPSAGGGAQVLGEAVHELSNGRLHFGDLAQLPGGGLQLQ